MSFKADARHFQLFRGEAVANNKSVVRVLARHFVGDIQHRQRELRAVIAAAAPLVVALVRVWRVELLNQVGVCPVDLHAVEAGLDGAAHRFTKLADHPLHFFRRQRTAGCWHLHAARRWRWVQPGYARRSVSAQPCGRRGKSAAGL